ncbi:hypothetical protein BH10ACT3_BH10ACT3_21950 [soil metagenome]
MNITAASPTARTRGSIGSIDPVRAAGAVMILLGGAIHLQQYWRVFDSQDIGLTFLANAIVSLLVGIALLAWVGAVPAIIGVVLSVGSLVALLASRTTGLLGFEAVGYDVAEYDAVVVEVAAVILLVWSMVRARTVRSTGRRDI